MKSTKNTYVFTFSKDKKIQVEATSTNNAIQKIYKDSKSKEGLGSFISKIDNCTKVISGNKKIEEIQNINKRDITIINKYKNLF